MERGRLEGPGPGDSAAVSLQGRAWQMLLATSSDSITQATRIRNVLDDVAINIWQALLEGRGADRL